MSRNCIIVLVLYIVFLRVASDASHDQNVSHEENEDEEVCERDDPECTGSADGSAYHLGMSPEEAKKVRLTRRDPVELGHIEYLDLGSNKRVAIETINMHPPIFEIRDFLSAEECVYLTGVAEYEGLEDSTTRNAELSPKGFYLADMDGNKKLTLREMIMTLQVSMDVYLEESDVLIMYDTLGLDHNDDLLISQEELESIRPNILVDYIQTYVADYPRKRSRQSQQVWLYASVSKDAVFERVQNRVQKLTMMPKILIKKSDFQIVHYGVDGHYNAHFDSSNKTTDTPCCRRFQEAYCRICRFMTVLIYLNDVIEGGETAFPEAGNITKNESPYLSPKIDLNLNCDMANLRVPAERGKAIMWYNHEVSPEDGWMGNMDELTWHGGCPIVRGEKWIANFWIKTTDNKEFDLEPLGDDLPEAKLHDEL